MKLPALVDVTCKEVVELVSDYLASPGMGVRDRARFEQHMHACSWCMDYLQQLQMATRAARELAGDAEPVPEAALLSLFRRTVPATLEPAPAAAPRVPKPRAAARPGLNVKYAFKFLDHNGVAPLSGFTWPRPGPNGEPGAWVEVARAEPCRTGVHACTTGQLSHWLHDTLWLVELGGQVQRCPAGLVATRGRLLQEVVGWREGGAARFAQAAYDHALAQANSAAPERGAAAMPCIESAAYHIPRGSTALCAFCCAMSQARMRGLDHFVQSGYDAERRWQSRWIARELALPALLARR